MSRWRTWMCLSWVGLAAACGGTDEEDQDEQLRGTRIDCAWFQGDNCYKRALAEVESCAETGIGTFSADGARCAYPTGTTINFQNPLELGTLEQDWDFDIVTNFGRCAAYEETRTGSRLETRSGTFVMETAGTGMQLTCPDGSQFYMPRAVDSLECGLQNLPGHFSSRSGDLMSFGFSGGPDGDSVHVFTCAEP